LVEGDENHAWAAGREGGREGILDGDLAPELCLKLASIQLAQHSTEGELTSGGTGVLLDVAALADEGVLGLGAGEAALGLGADLGRQALGSAGKGALRNHGGWIWVGGDSVLVVMRRKLFKVRGSNKLGSTL
jgi:hypothetical protein